MAIVRGKREDHYPHSAVADTSLMPPLLNPSMFNATYKNPMDLSYLEIFSLKCIAL